MASSGPSAELSATLLYEGRPHVVTLAPNRLRFVRSPNVKSERALFVAFDDCLGVDAHAKDARAFVVHGYGAARAGKPRERRSFVFVCDSSDDRSRWIAGIRSALRGFPIGVTPPRRRLVVFVNPAGGAGKADEVWRQLAPLFKLAEIDVELIRTDHRFHAQEFAQALDPAAYDGIVCVSGDGILMEVVNGLLSRADWARAIKIPIGAIPGGSGNALAASLGTPKPLDAAFHIIKGTTRPMDVWSCHADSENRTYYAVLNFAWALIADIDRESERYRWMGNFRFTWRGIGKFLERMKTSRGRLTFIPVNTEKHECGPRCDACRTGLDEPSAVRPISPDISQSRNAFSEPGRPDPDGDVTVPSAETADDVRDASAPDVTRSTPATPDAVRPPSTASNAAPAQPGAMGPPQTLVPQLTADNADVITIEDDFSYLLFTNLRLLSLTTVASPWAHVSDGLMDIMFSRKLSRAAFAQLLLSFDDGSHVKMKEVEHYKTRAVLLEPVEKNSYYMLDGENVPVSTLRFEVHRGLATFFAPTK